ncbi:MAG: pilus assembly protein TadG-related protein [Hyphomicrobiales bacterium]
MLTGLTIIMVIFSAGMGIDHMRALNEKSTLQKALDAAALAGASAKINDPAGAENAARQAFNLNYSGENGFSDGTIDFTFDDLNGMVMVTAASRVKTILTSILGREFIDVNANATAQGGLSRVEFVLAVDQSDSMRGSKQAALVEALNTFRNSVYQVDGDGNFISRDEVIVGMIPWQSFVNVGLENAMNWTRGFDASFLDLSNSNLSSPGNLLFNENTNRDDVIDAIAEHDFAEHGFDVPENSLDTSTFRQFLDTDVFAGNITPEDYTGLSWRGCMMARDTNTTIPVGNTDDIDDFDPSTENRDDLAASLDVLDRPSDRDFRAFYHPPTWGNGRTAGNNWNPFGVVFAQQANSNILRNPNVGCITYKSTYLTEDAAKISSAIDVLGAVNQEVGGVGPFDDETAHTDSSIGMAWALRMLDPNWAEDWADHTVTPAEFDDAAARKVIILLTDGANGIGSNTAPLTWSPYGDTRNTLDSGNNVDNNVLNIRTLRLCELAKQLNVEIFTIAFQVNDGRARDMLQNCATPDNGSETFYYEADSSGSTLQNVFMSIARQTGQVILTN